MARSVNGSEGLWVGFSIDGTPLARGPIRNAANPPAATWLLWVGIAVIATLLGSAAVATDQPAAADLSFAAGRMATATYNTRLDDEFTPRRDP